MARESGRIASAITGLRTVTFGLAGDTPVPGDYLGLGYDQIAVYRPSTGQFLVLNPANGNTDVLDLGVGSSPDLAVLSRRPGALRQFGPTFNADPAVLERTEAAVYRPDRRRVHAFYVWCPERSTWA